MIYFHPTYLIMALSFILTGYYIELIAITSLIVVHELGHYTTAKLLKFNVDKIIIYPYGGLTKIKDLINNNINQELLIAISGVIVQSLFYLIILYLNKIGLIRTSTLEIYKEYNQEIIFFNLLPIYPLDGSKIFNLLISKYFNYNLSNKLTIIISLITMLLILILNVYNYNYSYLMIIIILITYIYKYQKSLKYIYNKFLLERYIYNITYPKIAIIDNKNKMYKNKLHIFRVDGKYIKEKKYLAKYLYKWYTFFLFYVIFIISVKGVGTNDF